MDLSICEEASYDTAYDVSDHSNTTDVNVPSLSENDTPLVDKGKESVDVIQLKDDATAINNELPDHTEILMEEIPIRNTNFDKTKKESMVPINQSIHCSREGYRESRVKAATRVKRITLQSCIWHIMKKIPHKLGGYDRYREIDAKINGTVWNVHSVECFEKDWCAFIAGFNLEKNRWLSVTVVVG
ncbi:protein-RELATED SEQUENCE 5-like [Arachis hypogaea]|nr:protein-RELATED SEQUENCE 5-like [Arachis hypogaea]